MVVPNTLEDGRIFAVFVHRSLYLRKIDDSCSAVLHVQGGPKMRHQ